MKNSAPTVSSSSTTEAATESSVITSTTTTTTTAATSSIVETTTEVTDTKSLTPEEVAHKLTDNYWDYECFFHEYAPHIDRTSSEHIVFKYTFQDDGWTFDCEERYIKTTDERLTEKTMDGLKKLYNTYYSKNYDPFYSVRDNYRTINYELFGPSFTADTLPTDGKIDRCYTFIEYEGELYQNLGSPGTYSKDNLWLDDQMDITDVTEKSFTLKRKINIPYPGEIIFKIVFDEDVQDWRIEQKVEEIEYPDTTITTTTSSTTTTTDN